MPKIGLSPLDSRRLAKPEFVPLQSGRSSGAPAPPLMSARVKREINELLHDQKDEISSQSCLDEYEKHIRVAQHKDVETRRIIMRE